MRILGAKFWGQESAVFHIDTQRREVFAINSDRVSRIKKDNFDISPALDKFGGTLRPIDVAAYSFGSFNGEDAVLETKGTSYYWLNWQRLRRKIRKPKYYSDLYIKLGLKERAINFLNSLSSPKIFMYWAIRNYYWRQYLNGALPSDFHFKMVERYIKELLGRYDLKNDVIRYYDHHLCHAVSAYYLSPYAKEGNRAVVFTLDEHGDNCFSSVSVFQGAEREIHFRSRAEKFWLDGRVYVTSIAGLYSNFTEAMGLRRACDEGKVEALAAYGLPHQETLLALREAIFVDECEFKVDLEAYKALSDISSLKLLRERIGDNDFCATIQHWLEETVVDYLKHVHARLQIENLCLAGGVTANVIMNYKVTEHTPFKHVFVVPPMGDEGSAAGAALLVALDAGEDISWLAGGGMPYWGPAYTKDDVVSALKDFPALSGTYIGDDWWQKAAQSICMNKIIAVFQGRMEFGPRALGNRSILATVQDKKMRDRMNGSIKRRPWYQPFCPAVLEEERERLFYNSVPHKHMATAFVMREEFREMLPSAIHVDGTARPQFVEVGDNPSLYSLLTEVKKLTGFGVVINTSFNLHGRTIVNTPKDAMTDFIDCDIDELYIEGYRITRNGTQHHESCA